MTKAEQYRERAAELRTRAKSETSPLIRSEWENLAKAYIHLAEQADRNSQLDDMVNQQQGPHAEGGYADQHQQQQQQPQPLKDGQGEK
jgi:hypothetical protein